MLVNAPFQAIFEFMEGYITAAAISGDDAKKNVNDLINTRTQLPLPWSFAVSPSPSNGSPNH